MLLTLQLKHVRDENVNELNRWEMRCAIKWCTESWVHNAHVFIFIRMDVVVLLCYCLVLVRFSKSIKSRVNCMWLRKPVLVNDKIAYFIKAWAGATTNTTSGQSGSRSEREREQEKQTKSAILRDQQCVCVTCSLFPYSFLWVFVPPFSINK